MKRLLAASALLLSARLPAAVVLDFSGTPGVTNRQISADFGSNVPDTGGVTGATVTGGRGAPDIALKWSQSATTQWQWYNTWSTGSATIPVVQLDTAAVGASWSLSFVPTAGAAVNIQSFDMAVFTGYSQDVTWEIFAQGNPSDVLASGDTGLISGSALATQTVGFTGAAGQTYTLRLTRAAGGSSATNALAITNIAYAEIAAVPEPATCGLAGAGTLAALAMIRRRRRNG